MFFIFVPHKNRDIRIRAPILSLISFISEHHLVRLRSVFLSFFHSHRHHHNLLLLRIYSLPGVLFFVYDRSLNEKMFYAADLRSIYISMEVNHILSPFILSFRLYGGTNRIEMNK